MWNIPRVSLIALAAAFLLTGCVPTDPIVTPNPEPSSTPIFATEEEALAAATAAYAAYQAAVDSGFATYETSELANVAGNPALAAARASVESYKAKGKYQVGNSKIDSVSFVNSSAILEPGSSDESVQIYACLDVSGTDVLDSRGVSVLPAGQARRFPLIASLKWNTSSQSLRVVEEEGWNGDNFC
jgi:hypothetical protein